MTELTLVKFKYREVGEKAFFFAWAVFKNEERDVKRFCVVKKSGDETHVILYLGNWETIDPGSLLVFISVHQKVKEQVDGEKLETVGNLIYNCMICSDGPAYSNENLGIARKRWLVSDEEMNRVYNSFRFETIDFDRKDLKWAKNPKPAWERYLEENLGNPFVEFLKVNNRPPEVDYLMPSANEVSVASVGRVMGTIPREAFYLEPEKRIRLDIVKFLEVYDVVYTQVFTDELWARGGGDLFRCLYAVVFTCAIFTNRYTYTPDKVAGVTFEMFSDMAPLKRTGDCEDLAFINYAMLMWLKRIHEERKIQSTELKKHYRTIKDVLLHYVPCCILLTARSKAAGDKFPVATLRLIKDSDGRPGYAIKENYNPNNPMEAQYEQNAQFYHSTCVLLPYNFFHEKLDFSDFDERYKPPMQNLLGIEDIPPLFCDGTGLMFPDIFHKIWDEQPEMESTTAAFNKELFLKKNCKIHYMRPFAMNKKNCIYLNAINILTDEFTYKRKKEGGLSYPKFMVGKYKRRVATGPVQFDCYVKQIKGKKIGAPHVAWLNPKNKNYSSFKIRENKSIGPNFYTAFFEMQRYECPPAWISLSKVMKNVSGVELTNDIYKHNKQLMKDAKKLRFLEEQKGLRFGVVATIPEAGSKEFWEGVNFGKVSKLDYEMAGDVEEEEGGDTLMLVVPSQKISVLKVLNS